MDSEMVKLAASLGVGGILALAMFLWYRKDAAAWRDEVKEWKDSETRRGDTMTQIVKENTAAVTNNTAAVAHLTYYIKNGKGTEK